MLHLYCKPTSAKAVIGIIIGSITLIAAVIVTAVLLTAKDSYRIIKIFEINGEAVIERANIGTINAYQGMSLENGDTVSVAEDGIMRLSLDGDKYILLEGGTTLSLEATGSAESSKTVINLTSGAILNELTSKLSENESYEVNTPTATMSVRGTSFRICAEKDEDGNITTTMQTFEGLVEITSLDNNGKPKGSPVLVEPGKQVIVYSDGSSETTYDLELEDIDFDALPPVIAAYIVSSHEAGNKEYPAEIVEKARKAVKKNEEETKIHYFFTFLSDNSDEAEIRSEMITELNSDTSDDSTVPEPEPVLPESSTETSVSVETSEQTTTTVAPTTTTLVPSVSSTVVPESPVSLPESQVSETSVSETTSVSSTTTRRTSSNSGGGGGGSSESESESSVPPVEPVIFNVSIYDSIYTDTMLTFPVESGTVISKETINNKFADYATKSYYAERRVAVFRDSSSMYYEEDKSITVTEDTVINVETVASDMVGVAYNVSYPNGTNGVFPLNEFEYGHNFYLAEGIYLYENSYTYISDFESGILTSDKVLSLTAIPLYTITFNVGAGTMYTSETDAAEGSSLLEEISDYEPTPPEEKVFDYWAYTDDTGVHKVTESMVVNSDMTVTAVYRDMVYYEIPYSYTHNGNYYSSPLVALIPEGTYINEEYISEHLVPDGHVLNSVPSSIPFTVSSDSTISFDVLRQNTVTYVDMSGLTLGTVTVLTGGSVPANAIPNGTSWDNALFTEWDTHPTNVTNDMTVAGRYTRKVIHVEIRGGIDSSGNALDNISEETIALHSSSANYAYFNQTTPVIADFSFFIGGQRYIGSTSSDDTPLPSDPEVGTYYLIKSELVAESSNQADYTVYAYVTEETVLLGGSPDTI